MQQQLSAKRSKNQAFMIMVSVIENIRKTTAVNNPEEYLSTIAGGQMTSPTQHLTLHPTIKAVEAVI